jgi:hypothetical protein
MIAQVSQGSSEREDRMRAVRQELDAFEQRERIWRSNDKKERALELMARSLTRD